MAVKYVNDFEFPSDFGFQKNSKDSVPGKARGGSTTPQRYRDGGKIQPAKTKYPGHDKKSPVSPSTGDGAKNLSYGKSSDSAPPKSTGEKTSGLQSPAFAKGGKSERNARMHKERMARKARGGSISPDIADAPVPMGKKSSWNKDDAVSPGSSKRTPPGQDAKNSKAASNKFATDNENREPATKQKGNVERMSGWSDFKNGGKVHKKAHGGSTTPQRYAKGGHAKGCSCKMCGGGEVMGKASGGQIKTEDRFETSSTKKVVAPDKQDSGDGMTYKKGGRISNLGKYAHGGKVRSGEKPVKSDKYESKAGTPKKSGDGTKGERPSGRAEGKHTEKAQGEKRMAGGGLTRGTSAKKNAAIHAKGKKMSGAGLGALAALAGNSMPGMGGGKQPSAPGMGPPPPGMAPGMGSPPGGAMGAQMPPQGIGAPAMSHGGGVKHVMIHHISHGKVA